MDEVKWASAAEASYFTIVLSKRSEGGRNWRRRSGRNRGKRFINNFTRFFPLIRDVGHLAILR